MSTIAALLRALAALLQSFADAGGGSLLADLLRHRINESRAAADLADEQRLASALARGDLDAVESHAELLLRQARRANGDRSSTGDQHRSASGHGDGHAVAVGGHDADAAALQREITALL